MSEERAPLLHIRRLSKAFTPGEPVLADVDLDVDAGEIVCLLGPSGCGKTTLLRIIAGLEDADAGHVRYQGRDLARVPVHAREFGFMFQDFALFPHKNVGENVAFGLRMANQSKASIAARVDEMLALVNLEGFGDRSIFDLSGGERQRVALARSLAPSPGLLMLDEPLGALDRSLREELMIELRAILKRVGVTALYVTHDQQEAFAIADRIVVMQRGHVEQIGAPQAIHDQPASEFVARFLGFHNLIPARVHGRGASGAAPGDPLLVDTPIGRVALCADSLRCREWDEPMTDAILLIRPEAARFVDESFVGDGEALGDDKASGGNLIVHGLLTTSSFRGSYYRVTLAVETNAAANTSEQGPLLPSTIPLTFPLTFDVPAYRLIIIGERQPIDPATLRPGAPVRLALDSTLMTLL